MSKAGDSQDFRGRHASEIIPLFITIGPISTPIKFDLDDRLVNYSVLILEIVDSLPDNKGTNHLANQIVRSGTAPSLMYGEAQASESRKDFIHKMRLPLKELRETYNCLKILGRMKYQGAPNERLTQAVNESQELIAIFAKSIDTAIKNSKSRI
jgi:four helix bundle protein